MKYSKMKSVLLVSAVAGTMGGIALADPLVIVVVNGNGSGVSVYNSPNMTDKEYAILTELDVPPDAPGQTILILEEGSPARWTNDTVDEIDRRYGGDGSPPAQDLSKNPHSTGDAIEIFDEESGGDDGLSNVSSGIGLKDGNWQSSAGATTFDGCGAKLPGMVRGIMPAFPDQVRNMTFSNPFNPHTDLGFDSQLQVSWVDTSPSDWLGFVELPASGSAQAGVEFGITMELELLNNIEMEMVSNVRVRLSSLTAGILQSSTLCTATTPMKLWYIGG